MKRWQKYVWVIYMMAACRKPFNVPANISDNGAYLVIEGVISSNDSTFIKLSRTKKVDTLKTINPETGAHVSVESDAGEAYALTETGGGTYAGGPLNLDKARSYRLTVKTSDGKEYASDLVAVKNAPPIDSIGFTAKSDGLQMYVNAHDDANATRYYRWEYTEDWQFNSRYRSAYKSSGTALRVRFDNEQVYDCFGHDASDNVTIFSTAKLQKDLVYQAPITIVPNSSEKMETKYCLTIKQYALTSDAYSFWENLQKNTEKLGSIFDVLPSETASNFHCISNPGEPVVGYLSVGNVALKRVFITPDRLPPSYSPLYPCYCEIDTAFVSPSQPGQKPVSYLIPPSSPAIPIMALCPVPDLYGVPYAYTYSTILCVDCTIRGTKTPPPFWK